MKWKIIAAMDQQRLIGKADRLPWRIPEDIAWYQSQTDGQLMLMGRKTFEGIRRRPEGSRYIVVSKSLQESGWSEPGVTVVGSIEAVGQLGLSGEGWICGGGQIYEGMLNQAEELIISEVPGCHEGDTYFPDFSHLFEASECLLSHEAFKVIRYTKRRPE